MQSLRMLLVEGVEFKRSQGIFRCPSEVSFEAFKRTDGFEVSVHRTLDSSPVSTLAVRSKQA